jgi:hypothetical protein
MQMLGQLTAASPSADALIILIGDAARIVLSIACAYLIYGIVHMSADLLENREDRISQLCHKVCRVALNLLIYVIAALYGLEYVIMKMTGST